MGSGRKLKTCLSWPGSRDVESKKRAHCTRSDAVRDWAGGLGVPENQAASADAELGEKRKNRATMKQLPRQQPSAGDNTIRTCLKENGHGEKHKILQIRLTRVAGQEDREEHKTHKISLAASERAT